MALLPTPRAALRRGVEETSKILQASNASIAKNRLVTDPVLATVAAEVTSLLNSRPLTHLSVDPDDPDPLTPNHFLHAGARPYSPLKSSITITQTTERQFHLSQEIFDHFWKREANGLSQGS